MRNVLIVSLLLAGCATYDAGGSGADQSAGTPLPDITGLPVVAGDFQAGFAAFRAENGLPPVQPDPRLAAVAEAHARDMVERGYFDHTSADGRRFTARIRATGVPQCGAAENIAWGVSTEQTVLVMWQNSPPHRANLLRRGRLIYGLGGYQGYWVLDLVTAC